MRHRNSGRQLSRNTSHRKALRRNMAASLFEHGTVKTTEAKAKELRPFVEHLITVARKGTLAARRQVIAELQDRYMADKEHEGELLDKTVVQKLFDEIAPKYADRPGGYTRIIRLSERRLGDGGQQVLLQLVEVAKAEPESPAKGGSRRARRRARLHAAAEKAAQEQEDSEAKAEAPAPPSEDQEPAKPAEPADAEDRKTEEGKKQ
jgi:large subunit ribosomal protein L17